MDEQQWQTGQFELHRPRLQAVAYRMLGSVGDAEDAVQEAWLRLQRSGSDDLVNVGEWFSARDVAFDADELFTDLLAGLR